MKSQQPEQFPLKGAPRGGLLASSNCDKGNRTSPRTGGAPEDTTCLQQMSLTGPEISPSAHRLPEHWEGPG